MNIVLGKRQNKGLVVNKIDQSTVADHGIETFEETLRAVALQSRLVIGAHHSVVSYIPGGDHRQAMHVHSFSDEYEDFGRKDRMPINQELLEIIAGTNKPLRITQQGLPAASCWENVKHIESARKNDDLTAYGCLAIAITRPNSDMVLGVIQFSDKVDGDFTAADEEHLLMLASMISSIFEFQYAVEANSHLAGEYDHPLKKISTVHLQWLGKKLIEKNSVINKMM